MFGVYGACKVSGVPLVWTLHGADPSPYESHLTVRRRAIRSASKLIARERLAHFVAVSDFTSGCFLRILGSEHLDRLITIPNGFSALPALLALPPPQRTGPLKIGFVGRLEQLKGIFDLPAIALELQRRGVTYTFLIFGNGSMEAELKARFHEAGVSPAAVRFMGYEADPSRIYSQFSVMLHLSPADWLPTTTLESLAAGRPVVAYNAGGLPEIVRHGETGLLCPVGAVNEIADCLIDLHSAPSRAQSMGEKGRQVAARRFSVERMTSDYLELFSRILQTQRSVDNVLSAL
jgi:glycosyltransferase involved in cell wall biosynthesis